MLDWRKGALCLLSVAAMGVQAAHVTVDVPRHTTAVWTSGDGAVTNDVTNDGFDVANGTENVVVTFKPDYPCLELDMTNCVTIKGPINSDVTLYNLPRASVKTLIQTEYPPAVTNRYTLVRWIKSDGGKACVNTGYAFSYDKVKVECVVSVPKAQANDTAAIFGVTYVPQRDPQEKTYAFYAKDLKEGICAFASGEGRKETDSDFPYGQKTWLTCDGNTASWKTEDGAMTGSIDLPGSAPAGSMDANLYVFALLRDGRAISSPPLENTAMTLWSFRVSEKDGGDETVKCDLCPCIVYAENPATARMEERVGLYDFARSQIFQDLRDNPFRETAEGRFEASPLRDDEILFSLSILEPDHLTAMWTSGDRAVTNAFPCHIGGDVAIREKTRNLTVVFTPEYGYRLDYGDNPDRGGLIEYPGPLTEDFTVDPTLVPKAVRTGHWVTGCRVEHATAAWTRGDGSVTNDIPQTGEFLAADGETDIRIIYTPVFGYELNKTVCEIKGPVREDVEFPAQDLPTATMRQDGDLPMTDVVQWGTWSTCNKTPRANHGSFIETPGQVMFDAYTKRLEENSGDVDAMVDATVRRAFVRLKMLAENPGFAKLLKMYGYEFSNGDMDFVGMLTDGTDIMDTPETIRTVCDQCGPLSETFPVEGIGALKVLEDVMVDLDRVPRNWTGDLVISPSEYPVDDEILFDYADIQLLKAAVLQASSVLNILKGYNMKLDKASLRKTFGASDRRYHSSEIGHNGPKRILDHNPEFMDSVLDPHALALGQAQMQRAIIALKEFDDWQKTNRDAKKWTHEGHRDEREKRGYATCHFFEIDETRQGWQLMMMHIRQNPTELINLPYWTCLFDLNSWAQVSFDQAMPATLKPKLNWKQYITFRNLFEGRVTREHFPVFGGYHTWPLANKYHHRDVGHVEQYELLIDESPDPTIGGTFPCLTRKRLGEFVNQFTTPPDWNRNDTTVTDYFVEYTKLADGVNSMRNPTSIAAGITDPFYLLYPHFNCLELAYWEPGHIWTSSEAAIPVPPAPNASNPDIQANWIRFDMTPRYRAVWDADAAFPSDRVGICSRTFCADTEAAVEMIASDGRYKTVQLELAPWAWQGATEASWQHVKEMIASNGLRVASTTIDFPGEGALCDHDRWEACLHCIEDAAWRTKGLGIRRLSAKIDSFAADAELLYDRVKAVCDRCLQFDVDFLIEAGSQPSSDLKVLLDRLRNEGKVRNVALSFDPCACVLSGAEDPVAAFYALTNEIRQVYARDCKSDRANGDEDCPWGEGDFSKRTDFGAGSFAETLRALGFQGDILYKRYTGGATLTPERKLEAWNAMSRILDAFGVPVAVLGSPANPWTAGAFVLAYTNGEGVLRLLGSGATDMTPWADCAAGITEIVKDREVTNIPFVAGSLPDLTMINNLALSEIQEMGGGTPEPPEVAIGTGVESVRIVDGRARIGVSVSTNSELKVEGEGEGWKKAGIEKAEVVDGEVILTVPVPAEKGFMILKSKDAEGKGK